jgi:hypothetical protein
MPAGDRQLELLVDSSIVGKVWPAAQQAVSAEVLAPGGLVFLARRRGRENA